MKRLSNKILAIRELNPDNSFNYTLGHGDARREAARLASAHDSVMSDLVSSLECMLSDYRDACEEWDAENQEYGLELIDQAERALSKARDMDEHQKTEGLE